MKTWRKYTKEEDQIIFNAVNDNPHNLTKCFMALSTQLNRTPGGLSYRWYNVLSNPESPYYMGTVSITIGKRAISNNRKLDYDGMKSHPKKIRVSIFKKILNIINKMFKK